MQLFPVTGSIETSRIDRTRKINVELWRILPSYFNLEDPAYTVKSSNDEGISAFAEAVEIGRLAGVAHGKSFLLEQS